MRGKPVTRLFPVNWNDYYRCYSELIEQLVYCNGSFKGYRKILSLLTSLKCLQKVYFAAASKYQAEADNPVI